MPTPQSHAPTPWKSVVEVAYFPKLEYLSKLDLVGATCLDQLGTIHWARGPVYVVVIDYKLKRRLWISGNRMFIEYDQITSETKPIELATPILTECLSKLGVHELKTVGIRQFYALYLRKETESSLSGKLFNRYLNTKSFDSALGLRSEDLAITVEFEKPGVRGSLARLQLGAMKREQWRERVPYKADATSAVSEEDISTLVRGLPTDFVFVDVDSRLDFAQSDESISIERFHAFVDETRTSQSNLVRTIESEMR